MVSFYVKHSFALYDLSKTLNDQHSNCRAITWVYVLRKGLSIFNFSALFRFCKNNLDQNSSVGISVEEFQLIRGMKFSYQAREQNESISENWSKLVLNTVHWRASGPLWRAFGILWLCYFAWRAEKWAKQTNWLPISAIHKQPPLILGGQKRRRRGPEARQSTVYRDKIFLNFNPFLIGLHRKCGFSGAKMLTRSPFYFIQAYIWRLLNPVVAIYSTRRLVSAFKVAKSRPAAKYKVSKYRPSFYQHMGQPSKNSLPFQICPKGLR